MPARGRQPRLAVRAVIVEDGRLLLVNAWARGSDLLCAPGGGVELGSSLPDNLKREVHEETGLEIDVGPPCLVNEFHDPDGDFHQVDVYFRASIVPGIERPTQWVDPEGVVSKRHWVSRSEIDDLWVKPDSLAAVAWGDPADAPRYDPLEPIQK